MTTRGGLVEQVALVIGRSCDGDEAHEYAKEILSLIVGEARREVEELPKRKYLDDMLGLQDMLFEADVLAKLAEMEGK